MDLTRGDINKLAIRREYGSVSRFLLLSRERNPSPATVIRVTRLQTRPFMRNELWRLVPPTGARSPLHAVNEVAVIEWQCGGGY